LDIDSEKVETNYV